MQSDQKKNITVHGRVPDAQEFAKSHGIAVVPLLAGSGVRIKIIMNASWGVPMVSTRVGAEGLFNANAQGVVLADSAEEFSQALIALLQNPEKSLALGHTANQHILSNFGPKSIQEKIAQAWSV
jgi:glycosyltransferase involved in cell wall biosynthesis